MSRRQVACIMLLLLLIPHRALADIVQVEVVAPPPAGALPHATAWQRLSRLIGARRPEPGSKMIVISTAYAPSPYQTDATPCITAAGTRVRPGTVAANFLPLGTLLEINGEPYIVEDRMNPRHKNRIDIYFPSTSEAREFGRQRLEITIVGYGTPGQALHEEEPAAATAAGESGFVIDEPDLVDQVRAGWYTVRRLVTLAAAKVAPAVLNRYDVNCLAEENEGSEE